MNQKSLRNFKAIRSRCLCIFNSITLLSLTKGRPNQEVICSESAYFSESAQNGLEWIRIFFFFVFSLCVSVKAMTAPFFNSSGSRSTFPIHFHHPLFVKSSVLSVEPSQSFVRVVIKRLRAKNNLENRRKGNGTRMCTFIL